MPRLLCPPPSLLPLPSLPPPSPPRRLWQMGIVGLPNVGKSTLFNTLTKLAIPAENFPFCTIDPNLARINVPDPRFDWLVCVVCVMGWAEDSGAADCAAAVAAAVVEGGVSE